jgi:ribosomal protein S18 acetylase RimI-like enzyme
MTDVAVRPATVADVPDIERVARAAWHDTYDDILGPAAVDAKLDEWYDPVALRESITDDRGVFFVAGEDPVGFAQATPGDDVWHLGRIYVAPDRRGDGIGTALLARIESALVERGVTRYELAVLAENDVGIGFYEVRGFERFDERAVELAGVETTEYWYRKRL